MTGNKRIRLLPPEVANLIAAGEVVERPASVVKELVENALDADAGSVTVEVKGSGVQSITVSDDGHGMGRDDAVLALERHATSKIESAQDLHSIRTLGFRGEALPSIASVSRLVLSTWVEGSPEGVKIVAEGGMIKRVDPVSGSRGTRVEVKNLFFNAPVRLKFLRSRETEMGHMTAVVQRQALARPSVHFRLLHNGKTVLNLPPTADLSGRIPYLYGRKDFSRMAPVSLTKGGLALRGFASFPSLTRAGRHHLHLFINGRYVSDRTVARAVQEAYRGVIPKDRCPVVILQLEMDPSCVDVNVHPTKMEVRFSDAREVYQLVVEGIRLALSGLEAAPTREGLDEGASSQSPGWGGSAPRPSPRVWGRSLSGAQHAARGSNDPASAGERELRFRLPRDYNILGQYDNTFILLDTPVGLMIVDQHTAHERVLFERLMRSFSGGRVESQEILFPVSLELTPGEELTLKGEVEQMERLGFRLEPFGGRSFVLRGVPAVLAERDPAAALKDILDLLGNGERTVPFARVVEKIIYVMACRGAVKAHQPLAKEEMESILRSLEGLEVNNTCPHGRPVSIILEKEDILRMFMRR